MPTPNASSIAKKARLIPPGIIFPFILVASLFPLWGFANDITNPMVKAFSKILRMNAFQGSLVQFAFYGGYFVMAFPAALFIMKFSYKAGILLGLGLYATGALLFIPASHMGIFGPFLIAYFIITCGLSFLETSANPYVLAMGEEKTATQRLNFAQAFNPIGSLMGMFTAKAIILAKINQATKAARIELETTDPAALQAMTTSDLGIIRGPYVAIALVIIGIFIAIAITKMPYQGKKGKKLQIMATLKRLFANKKYVGGVVAQAFYVGAQIMCWTFIIHYGTELFTSAKYGMNVQDAEVLSQNYNMAAMIIFCSSRFICTFLLKYISPGKLLKYLAAGGLLLTIGVIFINGIAGLYCLVAISACMSLMFPTIYGIALTGIGEDAKLGAAGLIAAILGGPLMPPAQGAIIDLGQIGSLSAVHASFVIVAVCFVVIIIYGRMTEKLS